MSQAILVALIGAGIQASRTPAMHEREGSEQGLHYRYKLIDLDALKLGPEALPDLIIEAEQQGFSGLNITFPCKQLVLPLLTNLTDEARAIGAVNTVILRDGQRIGHNTDCYGFAESFRRELGDVPRECVVQLGAGGAGAAVAHGALSRGVKQLLIFDVDSDRAKRLAMNLANQFGPCRARAVDKLDSAMATANGVIHATPTGMAKYPGLPLPVKLLKAEHWVAEIVYFPLETELLHVAKNLGCRTMSGSGMAVFQAAEAFRLFTGITPDVERMARHFASMGTSEV